MHQYAGVNLDVKTLYCSQRHQKENPSQAIIGQDKQRTQEDYGSSTQWVLKLFAVIWQPLREGSCFCLPPRVAESKK